LDISEEAVKRIKNRPGVRIVVHDIMDRFPIEDNWADRVFCLELLEHVRQPIFALQEIARVIKPDGIAVISVPNPYYWVNILTELCKIPENEGHIACFRWAEMMTLTDFAGFRIAGLHKTFDVFPPMKLKRHLFIRAFCTFNSICNLYILVKR
jgi:SAM-dependent methyltransferase